MNIEQTLDLSLADYRKVCFFNRSNRLYQPKINSITLWPKRKDSPFLPLFQPFLRY